jgi:hypothetical protein
MKATRQLVSHCLVNGMTILRFAFTISPLYLIHSTLVSSPGGSGAGARSLYHPFFATGVSQFVMPSLTS